MLRCLIISDFNALNFSGCLENDDDEPAVQAITGPFGQVVPLLTQFDLPAWQEQPEVAVVWTQPEKVIPSFQQALEFQSFSTGECLAEVDAFCAAVLKAAARLKAVFVPAWVMDPHFRGWGMADARPGRGIACCLAQMNLRLAENFATVSNVFLLDAQRWVAGAGRDAFSPKLWYQGKIPFGNPVFLTAVKEIKAALQGVQGCARKLVVVDLDDTLWGGVVGDVGWENLRLGGHDGVGEAFADFQAALKSLTRRGIVLAMVSKNDESVALGAIRQHPEMRLELKDFAGWRINWLDKAANIAELAQELNLGLQSVVFIDENPVERARVREALPEVLVPDWPENPMLFKQALLALRCFDAPVISQEDAARSQSYATDRQRAGLKTQVGSLDEWLKSLQVQVTVEELSKANLARATQLFNKTNQLNLSTRRLTEAELLAWHEQPGQRVWVFRVADKFGDSGLTGLAGLKVDHGRAEVSDYLLSCRVLGRKVEETMVHWLCHAARTQGAAEIVAKYSPTAKNNPCLEFWQRSGFSPAAENMFRWNLEKEYARPEAVELIAPAIVSALPVVGGKSGIQFSISSGLLKDFIHLTGDDSPLHADPVFAAHSAYGAIIVHGMHPLLFLSALEVCWVPNQATFFKKISASFNRPIYVDDSLVLNAEIVGVSPGEREYELEFVIRKAGEAEALTTGCARLGWEEMDASAPARSVSAKPASTSLPLDLLPGATVEFDQLEKGAQQQFRFAIGEAMPRFHYDMLVNAAPTLALDWDDWRKRAQHNNLLAITLVSSFTGKCIPGSYGTCLSFDAAFARGLEFNRPYCFRGRVAFKSASTATVVSEIAINDEASGVQCAAGKINARVLAAAKFPARPKSEFVQPP